jgi:hypothetical protein
MSRTVRVFLAFALAGICIALTSAPAHARPLHTELSGAEEVTAEGVPNQGDLDGSGTFVGKLKAARGSLCYTLTVTGIAPATAAHIHVAPAGQVGPVVIALEPPTDGSSTACATASTELLRDIQRNPDQYYVNVHNADYPAGALRGQLG